MTDLRITEITPDFGATIEGWSPTAELDEATIGQLRAAFDEYQVLVLRDLDVPAHAQQYLCGLLVGNRPPTGRADAESNAHLYSTRISNKDDDGNAPHGRLLFHADGMWSEHPQELLSLYGETVELPSVPTVYVSAVRAWERLPDDLRARIDGRAAVHATGQRDRGGYADGELLAPKRTAERSRATTLPTIHPRTGRPILYVAQMTTTHIEGLSPDESEQLLDELFDVLYAPDNRVEHDWRPGDLVVWDNLAAQHARGKVTEIGPERSLRKVIAPKPDPTLRASVEVPTFDRRAAG
jgi:alpha-ketoglutarate-dependent taurine dioxygenase